MALSSGSIFAIQASATTGNVNGSGFNPGSANFNTDLAATVANTASPVVTSASYTFIAGDVNNWVYVKSGTHWQAGWYKIASVAAGAATLSADIGAAILTIGAQGAVTYNTVAGCTSDATATLSSGTYGVDYSQSNAAIATSSTATSSGAGSVILFAGSTQSMLGNFVHVISGTNFTAGWYEIIAETVGVSITTDRASTTGIGATGVINIGGAGNFNGLEDAYQAMLPAASIVWTKNGSYTLSGAISTANANNTAASPSFWMGFNSVRGDTCVGANRPIIVAGANAVAFGVNQYWKNITSTTTTAAGIVIAGLFNCKVTNSSATTGRIAVTSNTAIACEFVSQNGPAIIAASGTLYVTGCYIHDSDKGIRKTGNTSGILAGNILEGNTTSAIEDVGITGSLVYDNTIYGREAKLGTGLQMATTNSNNTVINNIFYGLATGINENTGAVNNNRGQYNDFFNNTTDVTNWLKDPTDLAVDPQFTGATQITGTAGNTSGSVLTDGAKDFSTVTDNVDYLHIVSGTGVTTGCYLITGHTTTTLTVNNALGTSSSNNDVYWVGTGHNFQIGANLKGIGFPNFTNSGSETTSYPDVGGVQRQEPSGSAGGSFTFVG